MTLAQYPYLVNDEEFKRLVSVLRLAVPYTGMIYLQERKLDLEMKLLNWEYLK